MSRSSIFSFETLQGPFPVPKGLLLALVLLVAVELTVRRHSEYWQRFSTRKMQVVELLETKVLAGAGDVEIVVLGSSRMRDAVAPRLLERELGLRTGTVVNLSITGGDPYDMLLLYRRNRARIRNARALIVGVEDWYFNGTLPASELEKRFAPFGERLRGTPSSEVVPLFVSRVWKTYGEHSALRRAVRSALKGRDPIRPRLAADGRVSWRAEELWLGPDAAPKDITHFMSTFYGNHTPSQSAAKRLRELVRLAELDGLDVILVHPPLREVYVAEVRREHGELWREFRKRFDEIGASLALFYATGTKVGIPDNHFYDYGHLTLAGTEKFNARLAWDLQARLEKTRGQSSPATHVEKRKRRLSRSPPPAPAANGSSQNSRSGDRRISRAPGS